MTWLLVLDPGHGRIGDGKWDQGNSCGVLSEVDLVNELVTYIAESLQRAGVRNKVLPTREGAGLTLEQRAAQVPTNATVISIHFDACRGARQRSQVGHSGGDAEGLAGTLAGACQWWGETSCERYAGAKVSRSSYPVLQTPDTLGVLLSPFSPLGEDAIIYARRLKVLGDLLGWTLAKWAVGRNPAIGCYAPLRVKENSYFPPAKAMQYLLRGRPEVPPTNEKRERLSLRSQDDTIE